jgi:hypothetical protein
VNMGAWVANDGFWAVVSVGPSGDATTARALSAEGTTPGNRLLLIESM